MRTLNSLKNIIIVLLLNFVTIIIGFISQKFFINTLGIEYLGINGLFSNILSVLSIVELGLGSAIVYNLYKPLAENDIYSIKILMKLYKKGYYIISGVILILGISLIPFLKYIVGEVAIQDNLTMIYIWCLLDVVVSYWLTYKRSILYADQKTYIVNIVHIFYIFFMNLVQIIALIKFQNYVLYLIIKIIFRIMENLIINLIVDKKYPYIREKTEGTISNTTKNDIISKIKGLLFHKIGSFVVLGTDNIIISVFLGVSTVGFYDNYYLIINKLQSLINQVYNSITASIGNLLIENDKEKSYKTYKRLLLMNSWIYMYSAAGILGILEPFISWWIGSKYLLDFSVLIILVINYYIQGLRITSLTFKNADGVFYQDRWMPIVEAISNIILSIIFVKIKGLAGVFLGTIFSTTILFAYGYYKYVYNKLFERNYSQYIKDYLPYIVAPIIAIYITYKVLIIVNISNLIIQMLVKIIVITVVANGIYFIIFRRTDEFKYYTNLINELIKKLFLKCCKKNEDKE